LIRLLESSCVNPELKPCIAGILGSIGDSNAVPVLTIALLNKQVGRNQTYYGSEVREAAARALGAIGDLSSVPDLIKALNDPYHSVRLNTIEALGKIRDIRAVQGLGRVLRYSRSSDIQISALKALAKIDLPQSDMVSILSILIDIFQRSNSVVKYSVVNALKDIGNTKSIPFLIEALLNETLEIRIVAAEALGQIGAQEAVPALIETLQHSENVLRYKAAEALGKIGAQEAVPALIMALQDTEKVVERTADTLLKPFSQSAVKSSIVEALGNIGTPETVPVLAKTLKDSSVKVRYNSAEALGKIGTLEVVSLLFRAIEDPHDYVKGVSAIALERVGNLRVLQKLIHCSDQIVYSKDVFPIFRKLFVKYHKAKVKFIPVYPPEGIRKIIQTFALGRFIK
jgi:HEAT repeat protein